MNPSIEMTGGSSLTFLLLSASWERERERERELSSLSCASASIEGIILSSLFLGVFYIVKISLEQRTMPQKQNLGVPRFLSATILSFNSSTGLSGGLFSLCHQQIIQGLILVVDLSICFAVSDFRFSHYIQVLPELSQPPRFDFGCRVMHGRVMA